MSQLQPKLTADEVDFVFDVPTLGDRVLGLLDRMRSYDPIFWSEKNQAWMVTGHTEVVQGFQGRLPLSAKRLPQFAMGDIPLSVQREKVPLLLETVGNWLGNMDEPGHQRQKKLIVKAFGKAAVEQARPDVRRYVREALDRAATVEGPFDFVETTGRLIPARFILRLLGLDESLLPKLQHWSLTINSIGGVNLPIETLQEINAVFEEIRFYVWPQLEIRRRNPGKDFISMLVTAQEDGAVLTNEEIFATCTVVLIAGQDTTSHTMALGISALAKDPSATKRLREEPAILADAIMEIQRKVAMSTMMGRTVSEDFEWKGHNLKKGDFVLLFQAAANRDPAVFPNPERIDFDRPQSQNLSFAPGVHHCVGFQLAKMVLSEFFPQFFERFDCEVLDRELKFQPPPMFRTLAELYIRLRPRAPAPTRESILA
jgi:cytochrome P450